MFYYSYPIHLETNPYLFTYSLTTSFLIPMQTNHYSFVIRMRKKPKN